MESQQDKSRLASSNFRNLRDIAAIFEMHIKMFSNSGRPSLTALREVDKLRAQGATYRQLKDIATVHVSAAEFEDFMQQLDEEASRDE